MKSPYNVVIARDCTGIFKSKQIEAKIASDPKDCYVKVDGKKINNVLSFHINCRGNQRTAMTIYLLPEVNK